MDKLSNAEVGQLAKLAGSTIRGLSAERDELKTKVAHYEKKERVEKIAKKMTEKGLEPDLDHDQKVAGLFKRDDLDVVESAVGMTAPQMKLASVREDQRVTVEGGENTGDMATDAFASSLASIE